eukprot:CAMPEP_0185579416 /NCGR_PEP_ID=MMETSP0434-20130131/14698_1 /TAXON_ID=626734 ORGANISM="Favella taraikaensis, Strain Fe Narragansett Bay" /NCGR_SAMPLE_ID=MMETSP0434 /ASSEMBLY_ACC=CAM_ASM_000379 /LENGTH=121 /DNA_ID=CAMNT_0028197439 /DNA_START=24 /DNA_END=389 /DNA_ORIENTATION=+
MADRKSSIKENPELVLETTVHLKKLLHRVTFKRKAPKAVRAVKNVARKAFFTSDVRIDPSLNKFLWNKGVRNVPYRVRVRLSRKRNEDEEAKEKFYTLVQHVEVPTFKGLTTRRVEDEAEE